MGDERKNIEEERRNKEPSEERSRQEGLKVRFPKRRLACKTRPLGDKDDEAGPHEHGKRPVLAYLLTGAAAKNLPRRAVSPKDVLDEAHATLPAA